MKCNLVTFLATAGSIVMGLPCHAQAQGLESIAAKRDEIRHMLRSATNEVVEVANTTASGQTELYVIARAGVPTGSFWKSYTNALPNRQRWTLAFQGLKDSGTQAVTPEVIASDLLLPASLRELESVRTVVGASQSISLGGGEDLTIPTEFKVVGRIQGRTVGKATSARKLDANGIVNWGKLLDESICMPSPVTPPPTGPIVTNWPK